MRKILTAAVAALTVAGASAGVTAPAEAQSHHGGGGGGHHSGGGWHGGGGHDWHGGGGHNWHGGGSWGHGYRGYYRDPWVWGAVGLATGVALASSYDYGYYGDPYYYRPAYGCAHWRWDPYWGRYVRVRGYC